MINFKKGVALMLMFGIFGSTASMASANVTATAYPSIAPIEKSAVRLHVYWGNVEGEVINKDQTNFDGFISVNNGSVRLVDTLQFEHHDAYRDRITSKQNPVIWRSYIYGKSDGVIADVHAYQHAKVTISTLQGEMTLPMRTLLNATQAIKLELGNGKEIVVKSKKIDSEIRPFHVVIGWGGPVDTVAVEPIVSKLQLAADDTAISKTIDSFAAKTFIQKPSLYPFPVQEKIDFSGAVSVFGGASMSLVTPFWFEKSDYITRDNKNYVSWKSSISGHFDGIILKTSFDTKNTINDDKIAIKTEAGGVGYSKEISLVELYKKGIIRDYVEIGGKTYTVVMVAVREPICNTFFAQFLPLCDIVLPPVEPQPYRVDSIKPGQTKKVIQKYTVPKIQKTQYINQLDRLQNLHELVEQLKIKASLFK